MSIPCDYTSFLAPISSSKLYNEVRACREKDRDPEVSLGRCHIALPTAPWPGPRGATLGCTWGAAGWADC